MEIWKDEELENSFGVYTVIVCGMTAECLGISSPCVPPPYLGGGWRVDNCRRFLKQANHQTNRNSSTSTQMYDTGNQMGSHVQKKSTGTGQDLVARPQNQNPRLTSN